jgi:hypothetical protein
MIQPFAIALLTLAAGDNPLLQQLVTQGVPISQGQVMKLPAPTMPDGLDAAKQRAALETIADPNHPVERLLEKSINSPFQLKISNEPGGTGRRVDLWYVAYGDFAKITSEEYLNERIKQSTDQSKQENDGLPRDSHELTIEERQARGLNVIQKDDLNETYAHVIFPLFDRVILSTTSKVVQTKSGESATIAALLDTKFADDKDYPNFWQPLKRDDAGMLKMGERKAYTGVGSYLKITNLQEPAGAIFVEYHTVFDEPEGWFNGANLLRSKLPLIAQDSVRKFRREVKANDK